jgi:hypothetical protein
MAEAETAHIVLRQAIEKTLKMLDYATHRGIALDHIHISNVVTAERAVRANDITSAHEVDFWASASVISKAIAPVTIESLNASLPPTNAPKAKSLATSAAGSYRVYT